MLVLSVLRRAWTWRCAHRARAAAPAKPRHDAGAIVVSASHGGASSGAFALEVPLKLVFFNDAGVVKDDAGIAAQAVLQARGVAAGRVAHTSGRIGDSANMWENGEVSHVNAEAQTLGLKSGMRLRDALGGLVAR